MVNNLNPTTAALRPGQPQSLPAIPTAGSSAPAIPAAGGPLASPQYCLSTICQTIMNLLQQLIYSLNGKNYQPDAKAPPAAPPATQKAAAAAPPKTKKAGGGGCED